MKHVKQVLQILLVVGLLLLLGVPAPELPGMTPLREGEQLFNAGRFTAAEAYFQEAARLLEQIPYPYLRLAHLYASWGHPEAGIAALDRALMNGSAALPSTNLRTGTTSDATSAQVYPLRLVLLADAGRWQEVEALARSLLDEGNKDTRIPAHLTRSLLHQSQCEEATEVASTWHEQAPEDSEAQLVLGTLTRDPALLCPFQPELCALVQDPAVAQGCAGNCDLTLGEALLRRGEVALAGCVLQDAVAAHPQSAEAHAWLGEVLKRLGETEKARQHLLTATRIAPEKPLGWLLLGTLRLGIGEVEDAQQALFTAHRLDPANPATCLQLAAVFAAKGQYPEVAVWTQATLERAAEDVEVWKAVARFYLERNLEQEGQPLDAAGGAVRLAPQDSEAQMLLGWAYLAVGDTEQALVTLDEALSLSPKMAFAHHLRGRALTALGRDEAAEEAFTRAADLGAITAR